MPIYKGRNEIEGEKFEKGDLFYANDDFRQCTETVYVHFTDGDIMIDSATRRSEVEDEINFVQSPTTNPIGESTDEFNGVPTYAPVALVFEKPESVDAVISRLLVVKASLEAR